MAARAAQQPEKVMQFAECDLEMAIDFEKRGGGGLDLKVIKLGDVTKTNSNTIRGTRCSVQTQRRQIIVFGQYNTNTIGPERFPSVRLGPVTCRD